MTPNFWALACTHSSQVAALALRPSGAFQRYQSPPQPPGPGWVDGCRLGQPSVFHQGVGNGQRGYNFFGQEGTSPKSVGFGGLVPAPCQSCFFPRIDLTTLLLGQKMASGVGAHFTGQGPSGHCSVVKRAELPAGNSSRVHPRHLRGRDPPSVWFTLDEH